MEFDKIRFEVDGNVATVTFDRPDNANSMDRQLMYELMHAAIRCDEDPAIRAVVATGAGSFFSAGGDLSAFADAGDGAGALLKEMTTYFHGAISRFSRMDAPIIAAVNGTAAGAGFSFAAACDIAIAADTAMFTSAYTAASLTPDGSSTYFVPRLVGMRRAMELMLTNRRLSAVEALEWGLVTQVVPADQLMATATALAHKLAAGGTLAFGAVKRMLHESFAGTLETQMEMEARSIAAMSHTHDGLEGITAFFEKRKPEFLGR
jgi:2-(1,2-epoxy-1,2-dihydrophenyl)acetyl-CoA isomerase